MSNPRIIVGFADVDVHLTAFKSTGLTSNSAPTASDDCGDAVVIASAETVGRGTAGGRLFGVVQKYEADGIVSVCDRGYVRAFYNGTAPTINGAVEVDGLGSVRVATSDNVAVGNVVISVDTSTKTVLLRLR